MEYQALLAGLVLVRSGEDDGSGPEPVVAGHEADRLASLAASRRSRREAVAGRRRRGAVVWRRRRAAAAAAGVT